MTQEERPVNPVDIPDQRKTLRVPLIVEKLPCGDGRKTFFGYAHNLSPGGLFIATVSPREPGAQFDLQVTLPAAARFTLRCRCEVVWKRHYKPGQKLEPGMGLRFLDLSPATVEALELWLQRTAGGTLP